MKLIIAGGREFTNYELLATSVLNFVKLNNICYTEIVCGKARGADTLGEKFGKEYGLKIKYFPADWDIYGKSAGYRRNAEMANYADALIAFWDGKSKGTKHMIDLAKAKGITVCVVMYE